MTALERALVVYAAAKGYEIEYLHKDSFEWNIKETGHLDEVGYFNFDFNKYRIMNKEDFLKVHDELSDFFKSLYTPKEKRTWNIEDIKKYKPAGFSCKSGLEEVSELLEKNNVKIGINTDANIIPNYDNFINDFVEEDLVRPKEEEFDVKAYVKSLVETPEYLERCKEVDPIVEILEAHKRGETIEIWDQYQERWYKVEKPMWDFVENRYRVAPKQPEAIPATEEELKEIDRGMICIKNKQTGQFGWVMKTDPIPEGMYIFDPVSKTWQDWGSK